MGGRVPCLSQEYRRQIYTVFVLLAVAFCACIYPHPVHAHSVFEFVFDEQPSSSAIQFERNTGFNASRSLMPLAASSLMMNEHDASTKATMLDNTQKNQPCAGAFNECRVLERIRLIERR